MAQNTSADEPVAKKSRLKLSVLLGFLILLAIGLAVAGALWFMNGSLPGMSDDETAEKQAKEPEFLPSVYLDLEQPLLTTVQTEGRQRYAQVYVSLEAESQAVLDAAKVHLPLLRSQLIQLMSSRSFDSLLAPEGRQELAQLMTDKVNELLANENAAAIRQVLFSNFVVQ
jgi:flagellar FliL protein